MKLRNVFKTLFVAVMGIAMAACTQSAKPVHELKSSFAGDFGDIEVRLTLNDNKTAYAEYTNPFDEMKLAEVGKGSWTYGSSTAEVKSCKIGGHDLDVDAEHGLLTMYLTIGDNAGTATIETVASTDTYLWAVSFKYDTTKADPEPADAFATFTVTKDAHVTSVSVFDFVVGDYSTLATPVERVNTKNFLAVSATVEEGYEIEAITLDGAEPSTVQMGYYCFGALQEKQYTINVTTKLAK